LARVREAPQDAETPVGMALVGREMVMAMSRIRNEPVAERLHTVRRALAVLEALAARPEGATPKELSQVLRLHLSTTYRVLNTLVGTGYVTRFPGGGHFRIGPRVAYLHHGYLSGLRPPQAALPFLQALQLATGETAVLHQLEGDDVVTTAVVAGSRPDAVPTGYIGLAAPAHAMAVGRVMLAHLPSAHLEAYLSRRAASPESPFPLGSPSALRAELERIRQDGYALDRGRAHFEICCVAAPVLDREGRVVAAIATTAPCSRFKLGESTLVATILAVSRSIATLLEATPTRDMTADAGHDAAETAARAALAMINEAMSRVG
jgi:IclR family pca regulon transcriptional regulator